MLACPCGCAPYEGPILDSLCACRGCRVESVERFGLLVEVLPGKTGLVHQSELDVNRGVAPEAFSIGDTVDVKLLEVCTSLSA